MYKINEFAKLLNRSVKTLQRWDKENILIANRSPKGRRYYSHDQYLKYIGKAQSIDEDLSKTDIEEIKSMIDVLHLKIHKLVNKL